MLRRGEDLSEMQPLMNCAVKVLDEGLREDFGFEHILWVYSGRRGIRSVGVDERARKLSDDERSAVAEYFSVFKGIEGGGEKKKTNLSFAKGVMAKMHPRLEQRTENVLKPFLEEGVFAAQSDGIEEASRHHFVHDSDENVRSQAEFDFKNDKKPKPSIDGDVDLNTWRWQRIPKRTSRKR